MWDDDYDDYSHDRSRPYEVRRVYMIGGPPEPHSIYRPPGSDKFTFSQTEIVHLAVAYIVLVICFAVALAPGGLLYGFISIDFIIFMFPIALIAVGLGFVLHEVGHKFTAQHFGCWSEFRYDLRGLGMALFFSVILGFIWAAPGATLISGRITRRENGIISLAGPATNMVIASLFIPTLYFFPVDSLIWYYLAFSGFIIGYLAVFNLLPIYPLDGSKIWKWDKLVYIGSLIVGISIAAFFALALFTTIIFP